MLPIEESIKSSYAILATIFESNDLDSVIKLAEPSIDKSIYHSGLKAKMEMLKAGLTMNAVSWWASPNVFISDHVFSPP